MLSTGLGQASTSNIGMPVPPTCPNNENAVLVVAPSGTEPTGIVSSSGQPMIYQCPSSLSSTVSVMSGAVDIYGVQIPIWAIGALAVGVGLVMIMGEKQKKGRF